MGRSFSFAALALAAPTAAVAGASRASDRALPMHFELRMQGPAETCGSNCKTFIAAIGAITADTPRDFALFAQSHDLGGATVVLDSDGGSVHGAIALGREIRKLKLDDHGRHACRSSTEGQDAPRVTLSPRADCEVDVRLRAARRRAPLGAGRSRA